MKFYQQLVLVSLLLLLNFVKTVNHDKIVLLESTENNIVTNTVLTEYQLC